MKMEITTVVILAVLALGTFAIYGWSNNVIAESESSETAPNNSDEAQEQMRNIYDDFAERLNDDRDSGDDGIGRAIDRHDGGLLDKGPCFPC